MKKFFGKVWCGIKKPFSFIKRKTAPAREFMKEGRPGGMILEAALGILFTGWVIGSMTYWKLPLWADYIIVAVLFFLIAEIAAFLLKLFVGGSKRCKVYFWGALICVMMENSIGTQGNLMPQAFLMSFALVLSVDILGRILWAFIKTHRFKQVFGYLAFVISAVYVGAYCYFLASDTFGESRIAFYSGIERGIDDQVSGFDEYLKNGPCSVASISYGPEEDNDIVTETLDYTKFDSVADRGGFDTLFDPFHGYEFDKVPVKGQIWYPVGKTDCPVFFMVHGNHESC